MKYSSFLLSVESWPLSPLSFYYALPHSSSCGTSACKVGRRTPWEHERYTMNINKHHVLGPLDRALPLIRELLFNRWHPSFIVASVSTAPDFDSTRPTREARVLCLSSLQPPSQTWSPPIRILRQMPLYQRRPPQASSPTLSPTS